MLYIDLDISSAIAVETHNTRNPCKAHKKEPVLEEGGNVWYICDHCKVALDLQNMKEPKIKYKRMRGTMKR